LGGGVLHIAALRAEARRNASSAAAGIRAGHSSKNSPARDKYKCLRSIVFVDGLPRQDNGKLYKQKIRERYWSSAVRAI
jgi:acyl-CoA synthetase (AMP-forming)/AMP-acid ligase II